MTLSIFDTQHNTVLRYVECLHAECRIFIVLLSVCMLNVIMLSVIMLNVIMQSVVAPERELQRMEQHTFLIIIFITHDATEKFVFC